jgi:hypothetical protein
MDHLDGRRGNGGRNVVLVGEHSPAGRNQCGYGACLRCCRELVVALGHGGETLRPPIFCLRACCFPRLCRYRG